MDSFLLVSSLGGGVLCPLQFKKSGAERWGWGPVFNNISSPLGLAQRGHLIPITQLLRKKKPNEVNISFTQKLVNSGPGRQRKHDVCQGQW